MDGDDSDLKLRLEKWTIILESLRLLDNYYDTDSYFTAKSHSVSDSKTDSSKTENWTVRNQSLGPTNKQYESGICDYVDPATKDEYESNNGKQVQPLKSSPIFGDCVRDLGRSGSTKSIVLNQHQTSQHVCNILPSNQTNICITKNGINGSSSRNPANIHYEDDFYIFTDPETKYEYAWSDEKLKWVPKSSLIPSIVIQEIGALVNSNTTEIKTINLGPNSDEFDDECEVIFSNVPPVTENAHVWSNKNQKWESKSSVASIDSIQDSTTIPVNTNSFASETNGNPSPNQVNQYQTDVLMPSAAPVMNYACVWNNGNQYLVPDNSLPTVAIIQDSYLPVNTYSAVSEISSNSSPNLVNLQCANNVIIANTVPAMNYTYFLSNENQYSVPNNFLTSVAVVQNPATPVNVDSAGIETHNNPSLNPNNLQLESDGVGFDMVPAVKYDYGWNNENQAWVTQNLLTSNGFIQDFSTPFKTEPEQCLQPTPEPPQIDSTYGSKFTEVCQPLQSSAKFNSNANAMTHPAVFSCFHCPGQFETKSSLQEHLLVHANVLPFSCAECPARFKVKSGLKNHLISHSKERIYTCNLCPARFKRKQILDEHLPSHSDERPVACQKCFKCFKTSSTLRHHMRTHSSVVYSCDQCFAQFKSKASLDKHLDKHSDRRAFYCAKCTAHFRHKSDLVAHMSFHDEDFFYCFECCTPFKSNCQLTSHAAIHAGKKPFLCCYCDAGFFRKYELKQHLLEHDRIFYSCNLCFRPFKFQYHLQMHKSTQGKSIS